MNVWRNALDDPDLVREQLSEVQVDLTLNAFEAIGLVGALQLALRHPGFRMSAGPTYDMVEKLKNDIIDHVAQAVPGAEEILRAGDDPDYDVDPRGAA